MEFTLGDDKITPTITEHCGPNDNTLPLTIEAGHPEAFEDEDEESSDDDDSDEDDSEDENEDLIAPEPAKISTEITKVTSELTRDASDLRQYYKTLTAKQITEDVSILKIASLREAYQLIATNPKHYMSIVENYKAENLQTHLNMSVRRVEEHLLIKFKLNMSERWVEVGFFDDDNIDQETMIALKGAIEFYLKHYEEVSENRRKHIASQFDEANLGQIKLPEKKALPDDYFDPVKNPELAISHAQRISAGYVDPPHPIAGSKKATSSQADASGRSFNIGEIVNKEQAAPSPLPVDQAKKHENVFEKHIGLSSEKMFETYLTQFPPAPNVSTQPPNVSTQPPNVSTQPPTVSTQSPTQIEQLMHLVPDDAQAGFNDMVHAIREHDKMIALVSGLTAQLETQPIKYHPYIYNFLFGLISQATPASGVALYLNRK
jgi:hypothetical protein